ncbi:MAG: guanylate kinase, partial [Chitinophagales bacterium]|nr:guanylate kinase [Chitinophagales bacterium]
MNKVIIITAPSGAGKTTIVRRLIQAYPSLAFSVSAATREQRAQEVNGVDYYFLSQGEFEKKIREDAFLEYEEVYAGNYYGTLKSEVERLWALDKTVVFDIDVKGAINIKKILKENALSIFIMPPNKETLIDRLRGRKTETQEKINMRISKADIELEYADKFDYCVVNDQ